MVDLPLVVGYLLLHPPDVVQAQCSSQYYLEHSQYQELVVLFGTAAYICMSYLPLSLPIYIMLYMKEYVYFYSNKI